MTKLPKKTRSIVLACMASTLLAGASSLSLTVGNAAAAGTSAQVTVSPQAISPTDQYAQTTGALLGTGAVVTVKVGPNNILRPGWPVEVQECDAEPNSSNDCDMITTLPVDQLSKERVPAAANGSVTFHFLVWAPLPDGWDPYSVIRVDATHPTALWIGDDPSQWATTGLVSAPVLVNSKDPGGASHSSGSSTLVVVLASLILCVGLAVTIGKWRRRHLPS